MNTLYVVSLNPEFELFLHHSLLDARNLLISQALQELQLVVHLDDLLLEGLLKGDDLPLVLDCLVLLASLAGLSQNFDVFNQQL